MPTTVKPPLWRHGTWSGAFSTALMETETSQPSRRICWPSWTEADTMGRRRRRSQKTDRRGNALLAQQHLSSILQTPATVPAEVLDAASVHLIKTSRRHRLPLPAEGRNLVCRACWSHHASPSRFRVRIKAGQRIKTCLRCGSVRRYGGGPKHHRRSRRGTS